MYAIFCTRVDEEGYVQTNDFGDIYRGQGYGPLQNALLFTSEPSAEAFLDRYRSFLIDYGIRPKSASAIVEDYEIHHISLSPVEHMRVRSGEEDSEDKLVTLLYVLARDEVPMGELEGILEDIKGAETYQFTNGYLARWAKDYAERLQE